MTDALKPHMAQHELAEARDIATNWTTNEPAIRMAALVLDLFEQHEKLRKAVAYYIKVDAEHQRRIDTRDLREALGD